MIIYNVTIKIDPHLADAWLAWLQTEHIPEVLATGCFNEARILKMLDVDHFDGPTYTIQYSAESKAIYNLYIEKHAEKLRLKSFEKWGDGFIAFRSVMQVIN